jgi:hypothetical protein
VSNRIVRENPLPPGFYWQDISQSKDEPAWGEWLKKNKDKVKRRTTSGSKDLVWTLFEVLEPVTWEGPGYPTEADYGATTLPTDVIQAPTVEEPSETIEKAAFSFLKLLGWSVAIGVGAYTFTALRGSSKG